MELSQWAQDAVVRVTVGYSSSGSGFIFDTTGETAFVVTNYHVVEDDTGSIDVVVMGRTYVGTLLGFSSDDDVDVAVLSVCCNSDFHKLPWEEGAVGKQGDAVMAMGRPRNVSVNTTGKVVEEDLVTRALGFVGHDAPIQPGSSGGPLLTMDGKVLGINVARSKEFDGIFYAVPYSTVRDQVVEWKARLVVAPVTAIPPTDSDLTLSGSGNHDLFFDVPKGRYVMTAEVRGNGGTMFHVTFENVQDGKVWREAEFKVQSATFTYLVEAAEEGRPDMHPGNHLVKVEAEGAWTITFEPVN